MVGEHAAGEREAPPGRFEDLVDQLVGCAGVTPPRGGGGFGRSALRWEKKIFAMLVRGRLVVKLPAPRVDALVSGGTVWMTLARRPGLTGGAGGNDWRHGNFRRRR